MSDVKLYTFAGAAGCYVCEGDYKKAAKDLHEQILYRSVERHEWMEYTDKLKADNESLRADAWRYRWLRDSDYAGKILRDMGAKYRADADQRIDAAMVQGEQS